MINSSKSHPTRMHFRNHGIAELQTFASCLGSEINYTRTSTSLAVLKAIDIDPHDYESSATFRKDYLMANLVKKFAFHESSIDRAQVALDSFFESEKSCARINVHGYTLQKDSLLSPFDCTTLINSARRKIEYILGSVPNVDKIKSLSSYSSGASVKHKRAIGDQYYKFSDYPDVTLNAVDLFKEWYKDTLYERLHPKLNVVCAAKSACVPKSWKTDRLICIEPHGNMFIQKGIGSFIRKNLHKVGINLNDQSINQEYARLGSIDGVLSTIDLKAASDSISLRLVEDLLPYDWFDLLMQARSEVVSLPSGPVELEKISAMGNGFTFELESLIFYALTAAVKEIHGTPSDIVSVYGDDIICQTHTAKLLIELLFYVGFETNIEKTFISSQFRESCGKHYFSGHDVTPFYIKRSFTISSTVTLAANSLRIWLADGLDVIVGMRQSHDYLVSLLPKWLSCEKIPLGLGDEALIGSFEDVKPKFCKKLFAFKTTRIPSTRSKYRPKTNLTGFILDSLLSCETGEPILNLNYYLSKDPSIDSQFSKVKYGQNERCVERRTVSFWVDPPLWV